MTHMDRRYHHQTFLAEQCTKHMHGTRFDKHAKNVGRAEAVASLSSHAYYTGLTPCVRDQAAKAPCSEARKTRRFLRVTTDSPPI